ncbi:(2Fe-2S)-binding protein [Streptomyces sp. NPDC006660]|uniref:(2Fe-2S)-binding protein n=1 Tax=Streptomyces sp. NPDC006660 TaxID=3156901 RepID=UPI0033C29C21
MTPGPAAAGAVIASEVSALGPFFALGAHPVAAPPAAPWQPMSAAAIGDRVSAVRDRLATAGGQRPDAVEARVAASVTHLGLAARLVSPALAAFVLRGASLTFALTEVYWQPVLGGPVPVSLPDTGFASASAGPESLAAVIEGPLAELAATMGPFALSPHILRGNLASALNGAATMIAAARPALGARGRAAVAHLLAGSALRGSATTSANGAFRRRSCCLIYRAAPDRSGALCGDCVLTRVAGRAPARS